MSRSIDGFTREQLDAALRHFSDSIVSTDVFMKDANGPKGGIDKEVMIRVCLRNRQQIVLESTHEDLYAAIRNGAKRMKRAVRRNLRRSRRVGRFSLRDIRSVRELSATPET
jgi:ribosome-associated translation inhibitor RaiA